MEKVKSSTFFRIILDYFVLTICLLVSAVNLNLFRKPIDFVTGGTPGLALIIEHVFDIPSNSSPFNKILPLVLSSNPAIIDKSVDLPHPTWSYYANKFSFIYRKTYIF